MLGTPLIEDRPFQLRKFYEQIFPAELLIKWLFNGSIPKAADMCKREFSFTLPNGAYTRFQSFSSIQEFSQKLLQLNPVKIDIGAVYNMKPSEKKGINSQLFRPTEKELVFDIDMTDYDDVRNCCKY